MWRPGLVLLALLAAGCGKGPYAPFDAGYDVHVILVANPPPQKGITVQPVCTLGPEAVESPPRPLKAGESPAVEVAVFRAPQGSHRLAIWEPRTRTAARMDLDVTHEVWVVMEMRPRQPNGRLSVFDRPPGADIGPYVPLVPVPD